MTMEKPFSFSSLLEPSAKLLQVLAVVASVLIVLYGGIIKVGQGHQAQTDLSAKVEELTADVRILQANAADQAVTAQALRDLRTQMEQQSQQTQESINRLSDEINYLTTYSGAGNSRSLRPSRP